jgi:hypothetical protein
MPPTIAPLMHPLASAAAVNTRSEVAITAHAKIFFIGSFLPHMTKRSSNTVAKQKFQARVALAAFWESIATPASAHFSNK